MIETLDKRESDVPVVSVAALEVNEISIPVDNDDKTFAKTIRILQQDGKSIAKLKVNYDAIHSDFKRIEEAVSLNCKDSLTHLTITNSKINSFSYRRFPQLTHLTFDGNLADPSPNLFICNKQLEYLDLISDSEEAFHIFLSNFKDVDFSQAENLTFRLRLGKVGSFPTLIDSLPHYLNGLRYFEVRCSTGAYEIHYDNKSETFTLFTPHEAAALPSWPTSNNKKVTHIIRNGTKWSKSAAFAHFRYPDQRDVRRMKGFVGDFENIVVFIDRGFCMEAAVDLFNALSEKTKLLFCYDESGENVNYKFINDFHFYLKQRLESSGEQHEMDYNLSATFANDEFNIDFEGATIYLAKGSLNLHANSDEQPSLPESEDWGSDLDSGYSGTHSDNDHGIQYYDQNPFLHPCGENLITYLDSYRISSVDNSQYCACPDPQREYSYMEYYY